MKGKKIQFIIFLAAGFAIAVASFLAVPEVFAQVRTAVTNGFDYAGGIGLGTRDLRTIIFSIVNVILGFLAIVAVLIIAYGGLVWMTSRGNPQQVEKAKKILINAVIGLVLIFLSYSIANFVFNILMKSTGVGPGGGVIACTAGVDGPIACPENPVGCSWFRYCKDTNPDFYGPCEMDFADPGCIPSCSAISLTPPPPADPQIRNKVLVAGLNSPVDKTTVDPPATNFQVTRTDGAKNAAGAICGNNSDCLSDKCTVGVCDGNFVLGNITYSPDGKFIRFAPVVPCGAEKCFSSFATYNVQLVNGVGGIQCASGSLLTCGTCNTTFTTGDVIDITSPVIALQPANICEGPGGVAPNNILSAKVKDDSGVTQVDYASALGVIGSDAPAIVPGVEVLSQIQWFPPIGTLPANPTLLATAVAWDGDAHSTAAQRNYTIYKNHCCNGNIDAGEEGTDCGGECQSCAGLLPIIDYMSPARDVNGDNDPTKPSTYDEDQPFGAQGNFVTIFGRYFGIKGPLSKVEFDSNPAAGVETWVVARLAEEVPPVGMCIGSWSDTSIIVEVPNLGPGFGIKGPIRVTKDNGGVVLIDMTNDIAIGERKIKDFEFTNVPMPGLCSILPTSSGFYKEVRTLKGVNLLGTTAVKFGVFPTSYVVGDVNTLNNVAIPNLAVGSVAWVTAEVAANASNALPFTVTSGENQPIIFGYSPYSPGQGAVGDYVTIEGANFGVVGPNSKVVFLGAPAVGDEVDGDITFPKECSDYFWTNSRIIVKVPAGAEDGHLQVIRNDSVSTNTQVAGLAAFDVGGNPKPGICKLQPESGPAGTTAVSIYGERMGTVASITFNKAAAPLGPGSFDIIGTHIENAFVPNDAQTGDVFAFDVAANKSNGYPFTVGACVNDNSCADPATQECCLSGEFAKSCVKKGECAGVRNRGAYRWSFIAGNLGPHVVFDCKGTQLCGKVCNKSADPGLEGKSCVDDSTCTSDAVPNSGSCESPVSSPAPQYPRDGLNVPIDAVITATFSELMDNTTITNNSVEVRNCGVVPVGIDPLTLDPGATAPCKDGAGVVIAPLGWAPVISTRLYNGINVTYFTIVPPANLAVDTWYQIRLITKDEDPPDGDPNDYLRSAISIPLNGNHGPTSDYIWRFHTRDDQQPGKVGCIDCQPRTHTLRNLYNGAFGACAAGDTRCQLLKGLVFDQDNVCVQLNADAHTWAWDDEAPPTRVEALELPGGVPDDSEVYAVARAESLGSIIEGTLETGHKTQCKVKVDLTTPIVEVWKPNCGSSCANAGMYIKFNKEMKYTDVAAPEHINVNTVKLYTCGGDYSCSSMFQQAITAPACNDIEEIIDGKIYRKTECNFNNAATFTLNGSTYHFVPGNYYRVVLHKSIQSIENKNLGNLNFDDPNYMPPGGEPIDSFSYQFKITTDPTLCTVDHVIVSPQNANVPVGGKRIYTGSPYSKPDICEPLTGQLLDPYLYAWNWKDPPDNIPPSLPNPPNPDVSDITQVDTCGNGVRERGEDCDDGNFDNNDGCDNQCLKTGSVAGKSVCGDNRVGVGEECDPPGATSYCSATCLNLGNTNAPADVCGNGVKENIGGVAEECDDGNNINGDGCSSTCLGEGSIKGQAVCGDGIVGFGEYCETCGAGMITSGSCPDSDFARGVAPDNTDNCTATCTNKNPNPVNLRAPYPICNNRIVDIGEDCDDGARVAGDGCSAICLNEGGTFDLYPRSQGQYQILTGLTDGKANVITEAWNYAFNFGPRVQVQPPVTVIVGTGVPGGPGAGAFRIIDHYPNGGDNCQNQFGAVLFSTEPVEADIENNIVAEWSSDNGATWNNYAFTDPSVAGQISKDTNVNKILIKPNNNNWISGRKYRINFLANAANIHDIGANVLDCSNGKCNDWNFEIVNKLCKPTRIEVIPSYANVEPNTWSLGATTVPDAGYYAQAYDDYTPPKINIAPVAGIISPNEVIDLNANNDPKISGTLSCDTFARICIKSKGNGAFNISARPNAEVCTSANIKEIFALYKTSNLQRNVLLLGCGLALEFPVTESAAEADDLWSIPIIAGSPVEVIGITYDWTKTELPGDQGNDAIQSDRIIAACSNNECRDFQAVDRWGPPFSGFRHAKVNATVTGISNVNGSADFYVGNLCEEKYHNKTLYDIYPLFSDVNSAFLLHFDDSWKAETKNGLINPMVNSAVTFEQGLSGGTNILGKSARWNNAGKLSYKAKDNINPQKGTISFWFYTTEVPGVDKYFFTIKQELKRFEIKTDYSNLTFVYVDIGSAAGTIKIGNMANPANGWNYVAATWDSKVADETPPANPPRYNISSKLYYNGKEIGVEFAGGNANVLQIDNALSMIFGSDENFINTINANIDEFEIRYDVLSAEDIQKRYIAGIKCLGASASEMPVVKKCAPSSDPLGCADVANLQCLNPQISATFNIDMDAATILHKNAVGLYDNILLYQPPATAIPDNNFIKELSYNSADRTVSVTAMESKAVSLNTGLVLNMSFDDKANPMKDESGNNNNGTCAGATCPQWTANGRFGGAFEFANNTDKIVVADSNSLDISQALTISLWIYPRSDYSGYAVHPISKWAGTSDANYVFYYFGTTSGENRNIQFLATGDAFPINRDGARWGRISREYTVSLNQWYHVVLSYSPQGGGLLYINGVSQGAAVTGGALTVNAHDLGIGEVNGAIDDVRIWNRNLSADEIKILYYNYNYNAVFIPGETYAVRVKGGAGGVTSKAGVAMDDTTDATGNADREWTFGIAAGAQLCNCDKVKVTVVTGTAPVKSEVKYNDVFTCAGIGCPDDTDAGAAGNQHSYTAQCQDVSSGAPIDVAGTYLWTQNDPQKIFTWPLAPITTQPIIVSNTSVNGDASVTVVGQGDATQGAGGKDEKTVSLTNFVCNNPWPSFDNISFEDVLGSPDAGTVTPYTNFKFFYCRDQNNTPSAIDDLPALNTGILPVAP